MDKISKLRPFYIAQILFERTDEDHYLTTAQFMEILEKEYGIRLANPAEGKKVFGSVAMIAGYVAENRKK